LDSRTWPALDVSVGTSFDRSDLFQGALADYDITAINEDARTWRVFFHTAAERDRAAVDLRGLFPDLAFEAIDVPDDNWAARSQAALRAVRVGAIVVAPPWDVPDSAPAGALVIVILPSMGFGTGHHATTRLCLGALQALDLDGRSVIDVGTGSGVLAIAAGLLGASTVVGFDDDVDAVAAARDNLALNPHARVSLEVGDLRSVDRPGYDVLLANLTGGLLIAAASSLRNLTKPGGRLILSGFHTAEESDVLRAFAPLGVERRGEEEEWLCVTLR
jgi:ribosomal protein L11 methyltransferase